MIDKKNEPTDDQIRQRMTMMFILWGIGIAFYIYDMTAHILDAKSSKILLAISIGLGAALIYSYRIMRAKGKQKQKNL